MSHNQRIEGLSSNLRQRVARLALAQQLAFAAATCERLIGNYRAFSQESNWGDSIPLTKGLAYIWGIVEGANPDPRQSETMIEAILEVTPDSDEFDTLFTAAAQDACFAVCNLLKYTITQSLDDLWQCLVYPEDTIDLFVQESEQLSPGRDDVNEIVEHHPLMQQEQQTQLMTLERLEAGAAFGDFKSDGTAAVRSNLGL